MRPCVASTPSNQRFSSRLNCTDSENSARTQQGCGVKLLRETIDRAINFGKQTIEKNEYFQPLHRQFQAQFAALIHGPSSAVQAGQASFYKGCGPRPTTGSNLDLAARWLHRVSYPPPSVRPVRVSNECSGNRSASGGTDADRKSTRLNSSHRIASRMPSSA